MTTHVLIVSPNAGFGEVLSLILTEEDGYLFAHAKSGVEALAQVKSAVYELAILDADTDDIDLVGIVEVMREKNPEIRLIVSPAAQDQSYKKYAVLTPSAYLVKPFFQEQLLDTLQAVAAGETLPMPDVPEKLPERPLEARKKDTKPVDQPEPVPEAEKLETSPPEPKPTPLPEWFDNVQQAAQYLTRLSLVSSTRATMLVREKELWAYVSDLPNSIVQAITINAVHDWDRFGGTDLIRYITMGEDDQEAILYIAPLIAPLMLAMVFDATTPFSRIRAQAQGMAKALLTKPGSPAYVRFMRTTAELDEPASPEKPEPESIPEIEAEPETVQESGDVNDDDPILLPEEDVDVMPRVSPPPAAQPKPAPESVTLPDDWFPAGNPFEKRKTPVQPEPAPAPVAKAPREPIPLDWRPGQSPSEGRQNFIQELLEDVQPKIVVEKTFEADEKTDLEVISQPFLNPSGFADVLAKEDASAADVPPFILEPSAASLYNLHYAAILIPRFPHHILLGDIAQRLSEWVPQICVAFGWRVERIAIQRESLQWVANISPDNAPETMVLTIRNLLSRKIFANFPTIEEENPSGDFWAPGYLLTGSRQLPGRALVNNFIAQTRLRQGIIGGRWSG